MAEMQRSLSDAIANILVQIVAIVREFFPNSHATEPNTTTPETTSETDSSLPASLISQQVDSMLGADGALFDHLSKYVKTPMDLYTTFEIGFVGCLSIDAMDVDVKGGKYARWRSGGQRHERFHDWRVVINDIRSECTDKDDENRYVEAIHLKYKMKRGGAISFLAKFIREHEAQVKRQRT